MHSRETHCVRQNLTNRAAEITLDRSQSGNMCVLSYRQRQQKVAKISLAKEQGLEQVQDFVIFNDEIQK